MSKIKVLVVPSDRTGVGKFRSIDPHVFLQNLYGNEFHVDIVYDPSYDDINFWKEYQIVAFHRSIGHDFERANALIQKLNDLGVSLEIRISFRRIKFINFYFIFSFSYILNCSCSGIIYI